MNRIRLTTVLGIASVAFGLWWIGGLVSPFSFLRTKEEAVDYGFLFLVLPMIVPGAMAVYFGFHLTKEKSKANIKGTVGILIFFAVLLMVSHVDAVFTVMEETPGMTSLPLLLSSCVAIFCYVFLSKFLMKKEGFIPARSEFIGKGIVTWIAFLIWLTSSELTDVFVPIEKIIRSPGFASTGILLTGILMRLFGPILLACVFYKIAMIFVQKNNEQSEGPDGSPPTPATPHTTPV